MSGHTSYRQRHTMAPGVVASATAYASAGQERGWHRGLPSPWLTFIVSIDGPVRVSGTVADHASFEETAADAFDVIVAGLHPVAAVVEQPERQAGVQLAVHPLAASAVLGCRAADLLSAGDHGDAVLGRAASELRDRVAARQSDEQRLDVVQSWVRERVRSSRPRVVRPEVVRAWEVILGSGGRARISEVARDVALSPRQLRTLVERELGITPKQLARAVRFDAAVAALTSGGAVADVAARTGYADQAHLAREFNQMAGCAPTVWLAEECRNIQDGGHRNRPE